MPILSEARLVRARWFPGSADVPASVSDVPFLKDALSETAKHGEHWPPNGFFRAGFFSRSDGEACLASRFTRKGGFSCRRTFFGGRPVRNPKTPGALATSGGAGWFETLELGCYIFDREASVLIPSMGERFGLTFAPLESRTSAVQLIACCAVVPSCRRSSRACCGVTLWQGHQPRLRRRPPLIIVQRKNALKQVVLLSEQAAWQAAARRRRGLAWHVAVAGSVSEAAAQI